MSFDGDLYPEAGASKVITSKGDLVRGNASGDRERYGIGSTGNVLTVASGTVAWQAPAGGGAWTERANVTLTSAASDIDSGTFTTDNIIMWSAFIKPVTTTGNIEMRLNGDSAASYCNRGQTNNGTSFQPQHKIQQESTTMLVPNMNFTYRVLFIIKLQVRKSLWSNHVKIQQVERVLLLHNV